MPTYFMHFRHGSTKLADTEGQQYPDLETARIEAKASAREILAEKVRFGHEIDGQWLEIADETGGILDSVYLVEQLVFAKNPLTR